MGSASPYDYAVQIATLKELQRDIQTARNSLNSALHNIPDQAALALLDSAQDVPPNLKALAHSQEVRMAAHWGENLHDLMLLVDTLQLDTTTEGDNKENCNDVLTKLKQHRERKQAKEPENGSHPPAVVVRIHQKNMNLPKLPQIAEKRLFDELFHHKSINERRDTVAEVRASFERILYLGTHVMNLAIADAVFSTFTNGSEVEMTTVQEAMVDEANLIRWSTLYGFERNLVLNDTITSKEELLADLFKAYVGTLYIDCNNSIQDIKNWLKEIFKYDLKGGSIKDIVEQQHTSFANRKRFKQSPPLSEYPKPKTQSSQSQSPAFTDFFAKLSTEEQIKQSKDYLYSRLSPTFTPTYPVLSEVKPPELPMFEVACVINGEVVGMGKASSIKMASARAAYDGMTRNSIIILKYEALRQDIKNKRFSKPMRFNEPIDDQIRKLATKKDLDDFYSD